MKTLVTVYDSGTGEITNSGGVPEGVLDHYIEHGTAVILDVEASADTHYVQLDPLAVVAYTSDELAAKNGRPKGWTWLLPERVAVDLRPLAIARAAKSTEINAAWILADKSSFQYNGKAYRAEPDDITRILATNGDIALTGAMPDDWLGYWKAMDNSFEPIPSVATWTLFFKSFVSQGRTNFRHAQNLKVQIAGADAVMLAGITWNSPDIEF